MKSFEYTSKGVTRRKFLKQAGVTLGAVTLGTAWSPRVFSMSHVPVTAVGTLIPFTGALAEFGPHHRNSAEMVAAAINDATEEFLGGPVMRLIHEDSETAASPAIDRARKLVDVDGVSAIIGALSSGVTVPVGDAVTGPAGVLQISPASTSPALSAMPGVFRTCASDALQGVVAAQLARGELLPDYQVNTASTIFVNNPYGQGLSDAFAAAFERRGGRMLATVAHPEEPQPSYLPYLEQALDGNPDTLMAIAYPGQATVYLSESRDVLGYTNWQFVDGTKSEQIIEAIGAGDLEGKLGTSLGSDPEWPGFVKFREAYAARYGIAPPLPFMEMAYDAAAVIGLAIVKAIVDGVEPTGPNITARVREVSNPPGEVVSVGDFRKAVEMLQAGERIQYSGAAGTTDFDENGDVVTPVEIWRYTGGTMETVTIRRPDEIPTA